MQQPDSFNVTEPEGTAESLAAKPVGHTPGPWRLVAKSNCVDEYDCYLEPLGLFIHEHLLDPDANLIAAAPELLEALEGLMELERRGRFMPIGREWDAARAAVAKAKATGAHQ